MEKRIRIARLAAGYTRGKLVRDLIAGLTVAAVAVPQSMAYALIAGIQPEYGLYTAIVMTALGSLFGSSAHLINGPTNAISLVVFGAVDGFTQGPHDPNRILAVALLALLVGLIQILIALLKLGDLTRYISESVIIGFLTGAGLLIALAQIPNILGLQQVGGGDLPFLQRLWLTLRQGGAIDGRALGIGLGALACVFTFHRLGAHLRIKLPELLLTLVVVSLAVWLVFGKPTDPKVGRLALSGRLPSFAVPPFNPDWIRRLWGGALAIALLGLVEALAIAKSIAVQTRQRLDYNRQCLAEGLANLGAGFFHCMPGAGSLTRSAINFQAGAATRLSGIISAVVAAVVLLLFAPLAKYVPQPALAGILVWTGWRIIDRKRLRYCLRATRFDRGIMLATAFAVVFISVEFSILIGTFLSFLFFVPRVAKLTISELVVDKNRVVRERLPDDPQCTKLALFNLEGELFFGAAPELEGLLDEIERRIKNGARVVVLRLKRARNPDMVCLERLQIFLQDMQARQVPVLLCGVRFDFARTLWNLGFQHWMPMDWVIQEETQAGSGTLRAVRRAYELLGNDRCPTCPRTLESGDRKENWYYMI